MDSTASKRPPKRAASTRERLPPLSGDALLAYLGDQLSTADSAVTAAGVSKLAKAEGYAVAGAEIDATFEQLVAQGRAFQHPSAGRSAKPARRYWRESASAFVMQHLQAALRSSQQITLTALRATVGKEYRECVDAAIESLLRAGQLFVKPGSSKVKTYTATALPATSVLTAAQRKTLEGILGKLNAARQRPVQLTELLAFLDGPPASAAAGKVTPTLALLTQFYELDLPARGGLSSMPIALTWRRYVASTAAAGAEPDRPGFERVLLESATAGRIEVMPHEWPATLAAEDLAAAIRQPDGRVLYYWRPVKEP